MPKVITLEKAADGSYVAPKNAIVEEIIEPEVKERNFLDEMAQFEKTVVMPKQYGRRSKKEVHEFIVKNGTRTAEFLDGVNKTVKMMLIFKKLLK